MKSLLKFKSINFWLNNYEYLLITIHYLLTLLMVIKVILATFKKIKKKNDSYDCMLLMV